MSRAALVKALDYLEKAHLILQLHRETHGDSLLTKPDKLFLRNTNCIYSIVEENVNVGNLRETFFINQLQTNYLVSIADKGDFVIDGKTVFEIGGRNKTGQQLKGQENAFLVKDDIEVGINSIIPLNTSY